MPNGGGPGVPTEVVVGSSALVSGSSLTVARQVGAGELRLGREEAQAGRERADGGGEVDRVTLAPGARAARATVGIVSPAWLPEVTAPALVASEPMSSVRCGSSGVASTSWWAVAAVGLVTTSIVFTPGPALAGTAPRPPLPRAPGRHGEGLGDALAGRGLQALVR